ncbi:hypothetical protein JAAARDRAFT_39606 [Jaapia argillacea MUCL 33604]|uniref:Uncharacterized protein n=1 Tax=Jaapia argillacea MUCL 33604 TaxID=933084 RepID=A0A067PEK9_9AGAM|nr:hypothetical protein JAAARDRAFT_39606 [Jaapia argillacea MUCL 33604]
MVSLKSSKVLGSFMIRPLRPPSAATFTPKFVTMRRPTAVTRSTLSLDPDGLCIGSVPPTDLKNVANANSILQDGGLRIAERASPILASIRLPSH